MSTGALISSRTYLLGNGRLIPGSIAVPLIVVSSRIATMLSLGRMWVSSICCIGGVGVAVAPELSFRGIEDRSGLTDLHAEPFWAPKEDELDCVDILTGNWGAVLEIRWIVSVQVVKLSTTS